MDDKSLVISRIDKTNEKIHTFWNNVKSNQMEKIKESWDDSVCEEYIKEVNKIDGLVNKIINQLEECKEYWESYQEETSE